MINISEIFDFRFFSIKNIFWCFKITDSIEKRPKCVPYEKRHSKTSKWPDSEHFFERNTAVIWSAIIIKNSKILDTTGSIQYFIDSIGVPYSQERTTNSISFRQKKNRVQIPSELGATPKKSLSQNRHPVDLRMYSTSRADPYAIQSCTMN